MCVPPVPEQQNLAGQLASEFFPPDYGNDPGYKRCVLDMYPWEEYPGACEECCRQIATDADARVGLQFRPEAGRVSYGGVHHYSDTFWCKLRGLVGRVGNGSRCGIAGGLNSIFRIIRTSQPLRNIR